MAEPKVASESLAGCTEYAVLCPRDGVLRSPSRTLEEAAGRAVWRDTDCGRCYPSHGPHAVVSRECSAWTIASAPQEEMASCSPTSTSVPHVHEATTTPAVSPASANAPSIPTRAKTCTSTKTTKPDCCQLHRSTACCDPDDCGPCCESCPTCPVLQRVHVPRAFGEDVRRDTLAALRATQPCCRWHSRTCEPPSELCCAACTEAEHPQHRNSVCIAPDLSGYGTCDWDGCSSVAVAARGSLWFCRQHADIFDGVS